MAASYIEALLPKPFDTHGDGSGIKEWRWNNDDGFGATGRGSAEVVTFGFMGASAPAHAGSDGSGYMPLTAAQKTAARAVLAQYEEISKIDFQETGAGADILFGRNTQSPVGYAYFPELLAPEFNSSYGPGGDVWISRLTSANLKVAPGEAGWQTLIHEVGHALGLKHPFDGSEGRPVLPDSTDTHQFTVMSYSEQPRNAFRHVTDNGSSYSFTYELIEPSTPMLYDIAAIQYLYGKNTTTRAGNNVYTFNPNNPFYKCIWDAAGTDTISVSNFTRGCTINLNEGKFSSIRIPSDALPGGFGPDPNEPVYDGTNNLSIAFGVTIEKAIGGSGTDRLIGNAANNTLTGNGNKDTLEGGAGNDTLDGGAASDRLVGGAGNDIYIVTGTSGTDAYVEAATGGGTADTVRSSRASFTLGANIENLVLTGSSSINGTGNNGKNKITGNAGANQLSGGGGADTLVGGGGNDTLDGGAGDDSLVGGDGDDVYIVGSLADTGTDTFVEVADTGGTDTVSSSRTFTLDANIEKLVLTSTDVIDGTGNGLSNTLTGNDAVNVLSGLGGDDLLDGGLGADSLLGGDDADTLVWDAADLLLNGGAGELDTLLVSSGDLDLTDLAGDEIVDMEQIDLASADSALTVTESQVLAISSTSDTLKVLGGLGDTVNAAGFTADGVPDVDGFQAYVSNTATLLIAADIVVNTDA